MKRSNGKVLKGGSVPTSVASSTKAVSRGPSRTTTAMGKTTAGSVKVVGASVPKYGGNASGGTALKRGALSKGNALFKGNVSRIEALTGNTKGGVRAPKGSAPTTGNADCAPSFAQKPARP